MAYRSQPGGNRKALRKLEEQIRARANYDLAILGMQFVRHGSGRFLWIGSDGDRLSLREKG